MALSYTETKLPVLVFKEGKKVIAYTPALDISSCGETEQKARARLAEAVHLFFDELISMGTLDEVLEECGWQKEPLRHSWFPPHYTLSTEDSIKIPLGD